MATDGENPHAETHSGRLGVRPREVVDALEGCEPVEAYSLVHLLDGRTIAGHAGCRTIRFPGISAGELAEDLARADVGARVKRHIAGEDMTLSPGELAAIRETTGAWPSATW